MVWGGEPTFAVNQDAGITAIGAEKHGFFVSETGCFGRGCALGWVVDAFEELVGNVSRGRSGVYMSRTPLRPVVIERLFTCL